MRPSPYAKQRTKFHLILCDEIQTSQTSWAEFSGYKFIIHSLQVCQHWTSSYLCIALKLLIKKVLHLLILLMEEFLHHQGCIKPCKQWDASTGWFFKKAKSLKTVFYYHNGCNHYSPFSHVLLTPRHAKGD